MNKNNDIGIIDPQYLEIFKKGVTLQVGDDGKIVGVNFNTFEKVVGRGITVNQSFIDVIKDIPITASNRNGNFIVHNSNR